MSSDTKWVDIAWNPIIGCDKHSAGCQNCYARDIALRLQKQGIKDYEDGFKVKLLPHRLNVPYSWKKPHRVFINSMSDLFHKDIPLDYQKKIFNVMNNCPEHLFWFLTKRAENIQALAKEFRWTDNIMAGVTIESNDYRKRLDCLKSIPSKLKLVTLEPLIGKLEKLDFKGIDWVIVGGESGSKARLMNIDWVRDIKDWCNEANVPFWFKQNSEHGGTKSPPLLDGKLHQTEPRIKLQKDLFDFL